jgi:hypothetical protein
MLLLVFDSLLLKLTMPGTRYSMEFADNNGRLGLMSGFGQNDKRVSLTAREFAVLAEKAAREKALELGWSKQPGMRSRAWVEKQAKR